MALWPRHRGAPAVACRAHTFGGHVAQVRCACQGIDVTLLCPPLVSVSFSAAGYFRRAAALRICPAHTAAFNTGDAFLRGLVEAEFIATSTQGSRDSVATAAVEGVKGAGAVYRSALAARLLLEWGLAQVRVRLAGERQATSASPLPPPRRSAALLWPRECREDVLLSREARDGPADGAHWGARPPHQVPDVRRRAGEQARPCIPHYVAAQRCSPSCLCS